jgi:hemolysin III
MSRISTYPPLEEKINFYSHAFGFLLSVVALIFLCIRASSYDSYLYLFSAIVFGFSLMLLYLASSLYHNSKTPSTRHRLKVFDHASIYILISGTSTPFTLLLIKDQNGWLLFSLMWTAAIIGVVLKLFFTGRYKILSTLLYVIMGWALIFTSPTLIKNMSLTGFYWLLAGGTSYTLGAVIYSLAKIRFNHAIFHLFVLTGSIFHFIAVYQYILK